MWKQKKQSEQNNNIEFNTLRNYTTLYLTYRLLYCKGHIQMTSNHSNVNVETKRQSKQNNNIEFNRFRYYTTLYHTYLLLHCKAHIQMTMYHSNVNVETKNRVNKMTTLN